MNHNVRFELLNHLKALIDDEVLTNSNVGDWHYHAFNEDYYIIGSYQAEKWLTDICNLSVFQALDIVNTYENDHFGSIQSYTDAESLANMVAFIYGEDVLYSADCDNIEDLLEYINENT